MLSLLKKNEAIKWGSYETKKDVEPRQRFKSKTKTS